MRKAQQQLNTRQSSQIGRLGIIIIIVRVVASEQVEGVLHNLGTLLLFCNDILIFEKINIVSGITECVCSSVITC